MRFAGYAALFDRVDRAGDVVRRGAFARDVREGAVPLLLAHRPDARIKRVEMLAEDARGLRVIARVERRDVREGMGLSFGYRVRASRGARAGSPRKLLDVD